MKHWEQCLDQKETPTPSLKTLTFHEEESCSEEPHLDQNTMAMALTNIVKLRIPDEESCSGDTQMVDPTESFMSDIGEEIKVEYR
jgi:hypothetical protein